VEGEETEDEEKEKEKEKEKEGEGGEGVSTERSFTSFSFFSLFSARATAEVKKLIRCDPYPRNDINRK